MRVPELAASLGVSSATARRDLAELDLRGQVRRVHGGAVSVERIIEEPFFDDKTRLAAREKQAIAAAALKFIEPTDSVFLDGGSTILALARLLVDMRNLTVVTNSLRVATLLSGHGPRVIVAGGELRHVSQTFVGPMTSPLLQHIHVDTAFMGTIGLTVAEGMTTTASHEAFTKELVMAQANRVVLMADSSKLGKVSFCNFSAFDRVNILVTDTGATAAAVKPYSNLGIRVVRQKP